MSKRKTGRYKLTRDYLFWGLTEPFALPSISRHLKSHVVYSEYEGSVLPLLDDIMSAYLLSKENVPPGDLVLVVPFWVKEALSLELYGYSYKYPDKGYRTGDTCPA
jgi:hypothetical protein